MKTSHSLFISDLHLCGARPHSTQAFVRFLENTAIDADALYILGDLFEYWAGDEFIKNPDNNLIIQALKSLVNAGTAVYFMHGNRDFLVGNKFCAATGSQLLADPTLVQLQGHTVLLAHGDALCTDDVAYQKFRAFVRNRWMQKLFIRLPFSWRAHIFGAVRQKSQQVNTYKSQMLMDVNQAAVVALLEKYALPDILIHGHTHRPNVHYLELNGKKIPRWVLGDWYEQGSYLRLDATGCHALVLDNKL